jgi:hypothetical protein
MKTHALVLTFALAAGVQGAVAQAPPTVTTPPPPTAIAEADSCAPNAKSALPRLNSEPGTTTGRAAEPLGDKLARSDGVLCPPPGVDPEIRAPTPPNAGNTPVIPPPGSPGGNPDIRPK